MKTNQFNDLPHQKPVDIWLKLSSFMKIQNIDYSNGVRRNQSDYLETLTFGELTECIAHGKQFSFDYSWIYMLEQELIKRRDIKLSDILTNDTNLY
jgi:hypothetical protein